MTEAAGVRPYGARVPLLTLTALLKLGALGCEGPGRPEITRAAPPASTAAAAQTPPAPPVSSPAPAPPSPEVRASRAQWQQRLRASREDREARLPTLLEALESHDDAVVTLALGETEREPRGVALSLLVPFVARGGAPAHRLAAGRAVLPHFRAFDFPDAPIDSDDRRIFEAVVLALLEATPETQQPWVTVMAELFQAGSTARPRHEAAAAAPRLLRAFIDTLAPARATALRRALGRAAVDSDAARLLAGYLEPKAN